MYVFCLNPGGEQNFELHRAEVLSDGQQTSLQVVAITTILFGKQTLLSTPKPRRNRSSAVGSIPSSPLPHYSSFRWGRLVGLKKLFPSFLISAWFQLGSMGGEKKQGESKKFEEGNVRCHHLLKWKEEEWYGKQLSPSWPVVCLPSSPLWGEYTLT